MNPQKVQHLYLELAKKNPKCIGQDYMVFEKHDGWYGYLDHGQPIKSRRMRSIPSLTDLSEELNSLGVARGGRLIFEIMVKGMPRFSDLNGYLNRKEQATDAYLLVHDYVSSDILVPFSVRYYKYLDIVLSNNHPKLRLAKSLSDSADTVGEWHILARQEWYKGNEGVILKRLDAPYSPGKRNADVLKIKEELSVDLIVIGVVRGVGKYSGTLGKLLVQDSKGRQHKISGMTDLQRTAWWHSPELIVGRVVEVRAMKLLDNGSLREPRFKGIRYDKTVEDID